jgi:Zn-dependent M16 (insulinase) family peptidase
LITGTQQGTSWLFLRGKATTAQVEELLTILRNVLLTVRLDNPERFNQMALEEKAELEAMLIPSGHSVVNSRLNALFNEAGWAEEQMGGIDYLFFLRRLVETVERDWPVVLEKLENMLRILLNRQAMVCNVTLDAANWSQFQPLLASFLETLPAAPFSLAGWHPVPAPGFEGLMIPTLVNYVGKGADLYRLGYQPDGSIEVVMKYLRTTWLWERVRVQGGAYGGFCTFNRRSGVYTYLSYRDPNLLSTLENYDRSGPFLRQLELSQEELTKSIIGAIGDMDAYQLPDAKGYTSMARYLAGDTDESRQRWREQILGTAVDDFHAFGEVLEQVKETGQVVVLGSQEAIQKVNEERNGWLEVTKVL